MLLGSYVCCFALPGIGIWDALVDFRTKQGGEQCAASWLEGAEGGWLSSLYLQCNGCTVPLLPVCPEWHRHLRKCYSAATFLHNWLLSPKHQCTVCISHSPELRSDFVVQNVTFASHTGPVLLVSVKHATVKLIYHTVHSPDPPP